MAEQEKETVVIEDNREPRQSYGWVAGLVIILAIIIVFFLFGGFNLFSGGGAQTQTETTTTETVPTN